MRVTLSKSNEYYPYGLPMPSSSDYQGNDYKYGGKEFDMFQKVNIYDFAARTYIPDEGRFWQPDPLSDLCHGISPYAFCAGDPVNNIDPDGLVWLSRTKYGIDEYFYDRDVFTTEDLRREYPNDPSVQILEEGMPYYLEGNTYRFYNENNGRVTVNGSAHNNYDIIYGNSFIIFGTADNACNAKTLHKNLFGTSYTGPNNPLGYDEKVNYQYTPRNKSEYASILHDKAYDAALAEGLKGALLDYRTPVLKADALLVANNFKYLLMQSNSSIKDQLLSVGTVSVFSVIVVYKSITNIAVKAFNGVKKAYNRTFKK